LHNYTYNFKFIISNLYVESYISLSVLTGYLHYKCSDWLPVLQSVFLLAACNTNCVLIGYLYYKLCSHWLPVLQTVFSLATCITNCVLIGYLYYKLSSHWLPVLQVSLMSRQRSFTDEALRPNWLPIVDQSEPCFSLSL